MPVSFSSIPSNWKQPLYWVEIDPSKAGLPVFRLPALLVGIMTDADATAEPDIPVPCQSQALAENLFGKGSHLASMAKAFFRNNAAQETWCLPVAEPAGAAATGTITVASAATEAGIYDVYIAGQHASTVVNVGDTLDEIATNIAAAINENLDMPVTAAAAAAVVTVTCRWKGTAGNDITLQDTYYRGIGGQEMPIGMAVTYSAATLAGGTGVPDFTTAISNLGEMEAEFVALPFTDSNSLLAWETEFGFTDSGRWGWMRQKFGGIWSAYRGLYSACLAFGQSRNSPQVSAMAIEPLVPSPVYEVAAAYTAKAARGYTNDPARPLQSLHLDGILPARLHDRFIMSELNSLSLNGMATQRTESDNVPMIARETTMYQLNLYGYPDDAFTDATTLATLARLLRNQRHAVTSKWPRHKLADDGTRFGAGQAIVTPLSIKAELVAQYRIDEFNGLVENAAAFKANLIVERDSNDPTRVNVLYPPDLINGLRLFAVLAQFRLQYNRGIDTTVSTNQIGAVA
ncbi:MAG TPA: phage tail sheath C-terminal domain-containing protein [Ktedonobacteraceae bacterium]